MAKRRIISEFSVEVTEKEVRWNGLDTFLLWLLRKRPKEGFWPHGRTISRLRRFSRRVPARK